ncbi:MAG: polysaccharide biosynthesis/export family protein [Flavobacteriaceae bacterium]|jgi:polysaccharide export outer membrane protein|nr:polysaccharide biosynthesis/export family protein [Flavobacteriaceae bacterium]
MGKKLILLGVLSAIIFTSCVPQKDLIYLQQKGNTQDRAVSLVEKKPHRIQFNDILVIRIKSLDSKLSGLFNLSSNESSSNNRTTSEQSLYFDGFLVNERGVIRIPVLDEVSVVGQTTEEIRKTIEERLLEEYFTEEAEVFVDVRLAGLRFTINGEVSSPGTKTIYQEQVNILEAVANAGDITIIGDRKNVTIIRQTPTGTEMHALDLTDANVINSPYYYLKPNDYILVNPLKQKSWGTGTTGLQTMTTIISVLSLVSSIIILTSRL